VHYVGEPCYGHEIGYVRKKDGTWQANDRGTQSSGENARLLYYRTIDNTDVQKIFPEHSIIVRFIGLYITTYHEVFLCFVTG
jgi:hypothetical protein